MDTVAEKIRIQRLIQNYSQEYMAFMLDISQAAYSNIESGKTEISVRRLMEIADILKVQATELMPKPKSSSSVDFPWFRITLGKLNRAYRNNLNTKHLEAVQRGIVYRDISKNLD